MPTMPVVEPIQAPAPQPVVEQTPTATPPAPAMPTETSSEAGAGIPDEVLQIPAMTALLQGKPAALSFTPDDLKLPELKGAAKHAPALTRAGIGTYKALSGDVGVLFNQFFIDGNSIVQADKAGQLLQVAPPFQAVNQAVASAPPDANPALMQPGHTEQLAQSQPVPPTFNQAAMPAEAQTNAHASRMKALAPGKPSEGARPGAGRLLNEILKRPV